MALGRAFSVAVSGVDGQVVEIEADIGRGLPGVHLVGLPDTALNESRDRVKAAVTNSGNSWPDSRVILALSPATLPKVGSVYDLGLALAVLDAARQIPRRSLERTVFLGELALDGRLRPVRGVLPGVLAVKRARWSRVVVPMTALAEAGLVDGIEVLGAGSLKEVVEWLRGEVELSRPIPGQFGEVVTYPDMSEVVGQSEARWALEVAAAGAHHVMLTGPPGIGKTMLAQRLPGILPPLTESEALEVTAIHSVAGLLTTERPLISSPPFIAPHHSTSVSALVGGGTGMAKPGAVSRAHRGVLFLDECAEMGLKVLEALRTPLEDGEIRIARRDGVARYPARFQLVLAANPCPCAPARNADCVCAPMVRRKYLGKLSGPLLDRVDLRIAMMGVATGALTDALGETTEHVRTRVIAAREQAAERWREYGWRTNAEVPGPALRQKFTLSREALVPVERALRNGSLTARGADRALRVTWTRTWQLSPPRPTNGPRTVASGKRTPAGAWEHLGMTFDHSRTFGTIANVPTMTRPNDPGSPEHAVGVSITPFGHAEPRVQLASWAAFEQTSTTGAVGVTDVGTPQRGTAALLTPAQARELAAELTKAADYVEGRPTTGGAFSIGPS